MPPLHCGYCGGRITRTCFKICANTNPSRCPGKLLGHTSHEVICKLRLLYVGFDDEIPSLNSILTIYVACNITRVNRLRP